MNRDGKGYYDFDDAFDDILVEHGLIDEMFYLRDLKQRKIFINADIDQFTIEDAVKHIMQFNREDKGKTVDERTPIILYVTSNGGSVYDGFKLIDIIQNSKTKC